MIWLVWRQHRKQALFALVALAALAAFLVPTGLQMHNALERSGLEDCLPATRDVELVESVNRDAATDEVTECHELAGQFASRYGSRGQIGILFWFLPLFVGLFWGAPLVAREIEHGTHRMVWTQGVSRLRWALTKFGLVGGGVVVLAACYALLVTWWRSPIDQTTGSRFDLLLFDLEGIVPIGYALFGFALGVFGGVLTRKSQAAMAITLVGFLAVRIVVEAVARPHFMAPLRRTFPILGTKMPNELSGDWVHRAGVYSASGERLAGGVFGNYTNTLCPPTTTAAGAPPTTMPQCLNEYGAGAYNAELFHPADRYWLFQSIETTIFVALAAILLLAAIHWVRRRIT